MKKLAAHLRRLDPDWETGVEVTPAAARLVGEAARHLGKTPATLWAEVAARLVALQRMRGTSLWFRRQFRHWLPGIQAGDPARHPELLPPICYGFVVHERDGELLLGTEQDFRLPPNYHQQLAVEEARLDYFAEEATKAPSPREGGETGRGRTDSHR